MVVAGRVVVKVYRCSHPDPPGHVNMGRGERDSADVIKSVPLASRESFAVGSFSQVWSEGES